MTTDPNTDRPRALHLLEAANFLRDAHRDGLSVQEIGTALRHAADEADPMVGSLARDGFGLDEIAAMPAAPAAVPPADRAGLRELIAEALYWHEWPGKQVWEQALAMDREAFLAQADAVLPVLPETARLHDEILTLRADQAKMRDLLRKENERANSAIDRETTAEEAEEEHRLALSEALGLGTGAPWDAIRERAAELHNGAGTPQPETQAAPCGRPASLAGPCSAGDHCCNGPVGAETQAAPPMDPVHILGIEAPRCDHCKQPGHSFEDCPNADQPAVTLPGKGV